MPHPPSPDAGPRRGTRSAPWFGWGLAAILLVALAARLAYVVVVARHLPVVGDAETYHLLGRVLAAGDGYVRPRELGLGLRVPTAEFPPMYPFLLALADLAGLDRPNAQRALGAVLGVVTVLLVGLLGRRVAGPRAGLVAAGLAALSPVLIEHDAALQAEGLYALAVAGCLLAIHVAMSRPPRARDLLLLGLLLGGTALVRSEAILLVPVAAVLVAWQGRRPSAAAVLRTLGLVAAGAVLVLGTWAVRSSLALRGVVLTSTNAGTLVAGGNCPAVYAGYQKGLWRLDCVNAVDVGGLATDEAGRTRRYLDAGFGYARDHLSQVPSVAAVRVLRVWGVYDLDGQVAWESLEGRNQDWHRLAQRAHLVLLALGAAGFVVLRRQPRVLVLLLTPVVAATLVALLAVGNTRFRAGADAVLPVAAAVAVDAAVARVRRGRSA